MNKVILEGVIKDSPAIKYSQNGVAYCNFLMTTKEYYKKGLERKEINTNHRIVAFGNIAEQVATEFTEGSGIHLEGKIQYRKWESPEHGVKWITEIIASAAAKKQKESNEDIPF